MKSKRARALLAYMALSDGKSRSREEIMALLWSDRGEAQARASLRQVLTGLRKDLGDQCAAAFRTTSEAVLLDPQHVTLEKGTPGAELLAGFHLCDPAFEEWLRDERLNDGDQERESTRSVALPPSGKPAVAVIPFKNMSDEPDQSYFSDGITEDIATELSRFRLIDVLARQSAFVLRDRGEEMFDALRNLGADYLVEGSVRKAGNRIRLTVQLTHSKTRKQIWAERYDRELTDVFAIQDELVHAIVTALSSRLETEGMEQAFRKRSGNLAAYDYYLRGLRHERQYDSRSVVAGREALENAVTLDPSFARAHGLLAFFKLVSGWFRGANDYASDEILALAKKAVELDPTDGDCFAKLGLVHLDRNEHEQARHNLETALAMNPNDTHAWAHYAWYLVTAGRPEEALAYLDRTLAVEPHPPNWNWDVRAEALYDLGRYAEAAEVLERKVLLYHYNFGQLAACYGQLGQAEKAAAYWAKALEINPQTRLSWIGDGLGYQRQENRDHWAVGPAKGKIVRLIGGREFLAARAVPRRVKANTSDQRPLASSASASTSRTASPGTSVATKASPIPRARMKRSLPSITFLSCAMRPTSASTPGRSPGMSPMSHFMPIARRCARTRLGAS
ncbi:MAG: tetratricopeptide repeat protein [Rhodobacteraceae bacterium]|nr:tetratricopeptide repeat protein [Paracoccaceae bacterium]